MSPLTFPNYINLVNVALFNEILKLNPVGYWPLGEISGDALDLSGNGNDGVVTIGAGIRNAPALDVFNGDGSIEFDSLITKVQILDAVALQNIFDGGGSIFFMFNANSSGEGSAGRVISKGSVTWRIEVGGSDPLAMIFRQAWSGTDGQWTALTIAPLASIIIGVLTYNSDSVSNDATIYIWNGTSRQTLTVGDGLLRTSTPTGTRTSDVGDDIVIGNRAAQNVTFDGRIDEIPLYDYALTEDQAFQLIDAARGAADFVPIMPASIRRILNYFPEFTHESKLIQSMAIGDYEEIRSRLFDLIDQLSENSTGVQANDTGVIFWEEALGLIANPSDSIELKRSNILSKTIRKNRIRNVDIGNIARLYTVGPRTFTRQQITSEINIPVFSLEGFGEGQQIYVGPTLVTIVSVDVGNRIFIVNSPVTAHAYAAITTKLITVSETFPSYTFNVLFNPGDIEDTVAMNEAIEQAKPAHLGFSVQTLWSPFIWDSDILEGWNKSEIADIAGYWDLDQLTGDMIDISGKGNDGVVQLGAGTRGVAALSPLSQTNGEACMTFDALDSKVQIPNNASLLDLFDGGGFYALKFNAKSDGQNGVGRLWDKIFEGHTLITRDESGGNIRLEFVQFFSGTNGQWQTPINVALNTDHELIIIYDSDDVGNDPVFVLDGVELTVGSGLTRTSTPTGTRNSDSGPLIIGSNDVTSFSYDGEIDEFMVSGDSITTVEAQAWFATHLVDEMNTNILGPRFF